LVVAEFPGERFIKICGVTNLGDVETVIEAGADGLGLILATSSRRVSIEQAGELTNAAKGRVVVTGVFRDSDDSVILSALDLLALDVVQIHGALGPELLGALRQRGLKVVKALAIGSAEFFDFDDSEVDAVLIDGPSPGSGKTHSWDDLSERKFRVPVIAAGGLTPDNVGDTIRFTGAWGVDTASGVESAPGVKDRTLVRRFVENARLAMEQRED
jgi:phosphoribosylanthranilate isomerase